MFFKIFLDYFKILLGQVTDKAFLADHLLYSLLWLPNLRNAVHNQSEEQIKSQQAKEKKYCNLKRWRILEVKQKLYLKYKALGHFETVFSKEADVAQNVALATFWKGCSLWIAFCTFSE